MKLVAFSLLLLNVVYLAYQFMGQPPEVVRVTERDEHQGNIKLLDERDEARVKQLSQVVDNPIREQGNPDEQNSSCIGIGPFADVFSGQSALEQIEALDVVGQLRAVDVATGESDYRVLIPPATSPEEAFRKLRELQASNVDSYVITQGELTLGISLGVFSAAEGAEVLKNRLSNIGYEAEIIEIERQSRSYWIELRDEQYGLLEASNWLADKAELTNREMICSER